MKNTTKQTYRIPPREESLLIWFFGRGVVSFQQSSLGPQLDRAAMFSGSHVTCHKCHGGFRTVRVAKCRKCHNGWTQQSREEFERSLIRDAMSPGGRHQTRATPRPGPNRCMECGGSGVIEVLDNLLPDSFEVDDICEHCNGSGISPKGYHEWSYESEWTAIPSLQSDRTPPREPEYDDVVNHGFVARRLSQMEETNVKALLAYYAFGLAWERGSHRGRLWPLIPLTQAGSEILKRFPSWPKDVDRGVLPKPWDELNPASGESKTNPRIRPNWSDLTQPERLDIIADIPDNSPVSIHPALWKEATRQAQDLLNKSTRDWLVSSWRVENAKMYPGGSSECTRGIGKPTRGID